MDPYRDGLNDPLDIPEAWREQLRVIQAVCPTAVLAGGALRDRALGREVKDLDIFIFADTESQARDAMDDLTEAGLEVPFEPQDLTMYPEDQNLEVIAVAELANPIAVYPVQLIFVRWPTDRIVERFDYGLCRLAYDGQKLIKTPEFYEDAKAQVFRLRRERPTPVSMRGSIRRYARLVADRYLGWDWWPYVPDCDFCPASC